MEDVSTNSEIGLAINPDSWDSRICRAFFSGYCPEGSSCKLKHIQPIRETVCKIFLLHGECKKGPLCLYIHEIIPEKLPECRNFSTESGCNNPNCKFRHLPQTRESKECAYYNMGTKYLGFCDQGKFCKFKHLRKELCYDFLEGRCNWDSCKKYHLKNIAEDYLAQAFYKLNPGNEEVKYENL